MKMFWASSITAIIVNIRWQNSPLITYEDVIRVEANKLRGDLKAKLSTARGPSGQFISDATLSITVELH